MLKRKLSISKFLISARRTVKNLFFYCSDKFIDFVTSIKIKAKLYRKGKAFFVVVNKKYLFALGTLLINLKELNIEYDSIIIYHDSDIGQAEIDRFSFEKRCKFIKYTFLDFKKEFDLTDEDINKDFIYNYSHLSYIKFFVLKHLVSFKTIILLDLDILITQDIKELFLLNCNIAWRNGDAFIKKFFRRDSYGKDFLNKYNITNQTATPNGGLVLVNDNFNYISALKEGKKFLVENILHFSAGIDELVFAYIYLINDLKLISLDAYLYNAFPQFATTNSKVIHFFQEMKPWKNPLTQNIFPRYLEYYHKQLKYTNLECDDLIYHPKIGNDIIKKNIIFDKWSNLFAKYKIASVLGLYPIFKDNLLELHYSEMTYIEVKAELYKNSFTCSIIFLENKFNNNSDHFIIYSILEKYSFIHKIITGDRLRFYTDGIQDYNLPDILNTFFLILFLITSLLKKKKDKYSYSIYNKFYILSEDNHKFLCVDGDNNLVFSDLPIYYILYDMDKSCLYDPINHTYLNNIGISCEINQDDTISLRKGKYYISARNNGSITMKEKKLGWEKFSIVPSKQNKNNKRSLMLLRTHNGRFLHLDILKSFRQEKNPVNYVQYDTRSNSKIYNPILNTYLDIAYRYIIVNKEKITFAKNNNSKLDIILIPQIM